MFIKLLIHLLTKVCRCPVIHLVVFQVSHPYKSIDFTTVVKDSVFLEISFCFPTQGIFQQRLHLLSLYGSAHLLLFLQHTWLLSATLANRQTANLCVWKCSTNLHVWKLSSYNRNMKEKETRNLMSIKVFSVPVIIVYIVLKRRHCCDILPAVKARYSSFIHTQKQEVWKELIRILSLYKRTVNNLVTMEHKQSKHCWTRLT
jgi:hypothetical protein